MRGVLGQVLHRDTALLKDGKVFCIKLVRKVCNFLDQVDALMCVKVRASLGYRALLLLPVQEFVDVTGDARRLVAVETVGLGDGKHLVGQRHEGHRHFHLARHV